MARRRKSRPADNDRPEMEFEPEGGPIDRLQSMLDGRLLFPMKRQTTTKTEAERARPRGGPAPEAPGGEEGEADEAESPGGTTGLRCSVTCDASGSTSIGPASRTSSPKRHRTSSSPPRPPPRTTGFRSDRRSCSRARCRTEPTCPVASPASQSPPAACGCTQRRPTAACGVRTTAAPRGRHHAGLGSQSVDTLVRLSGVRGDRDRSRQSRPRVRRGRRGDSDWSGGGTITGVGPIVSNDGGVNWATEPASPVARRLVVLHARRRS